MEKGKEMSLRVGKGREVRTWKSKGSQIGPGI